jgi:glycosyltransferase involved in cell wall biosynthesis
MLTQFGRGKAIKGGIAERKIVVKPNFVPDPPAPGRGDGGYVVYAGRLFEGKGTETLVEAWRHLPSVRLKILGDGALRPSLEATVKRENLNIEFAGMLDRAAVLTMMADAALVVVPSEWYEAFGMVVGESFACGTPVLASRIGSLDELVDERLTGRKFNAGDPNDLAKVAGEMLADEVGLREMRSNARAYFDAHLTEERNFAQLMKIYSDVMAQNGLGNLRNAGDEPRAG